MFRWLLRILVGCKHDWRVTDTADLPSRGEVAFEVAGMRSNYDSVYRRTHVHTMVCLTCGKVKTVRTRN